uniref:Ribosome biogenesis protein NOP53 n=1 Tax=Melanopsichium pennsylvanicum 4 TaxID=1398559 RepID=A0A077RDP8_9BASI|nr:related to Glioma tumor suppressor candidate region gene 2 protein [Melanopsichium pennsylvanicum 4]
MAPTRTKASSIGAPSQHSQSSRKGKKAWRKNIDLTTTEQFLQEQSDPLRATASDVLFVEDRSGQETLLAKQARTKRPLKSLEILQNKIGHAPLLPARKQKAAVGVDKKLESRLRKMVGRNQVSTKGDASKGKAQQDKAEERGWIPAQVSKPTVHIPKTLRRDDYNNIASSLAAIELPHPGTSYNPDLESHEALIQQAFEIEKRLEENEQMDLAERQNWQAKLATIVAREAELRLQKNDEIKRYRGMDVDLPTASDDDVEQDQNDCSSGDTSDEEEGGASGEPKHNRNNELKKHVCKPLKLHVVKKLELKLQQSFNFLHSNVDKLDLTQQELKLLNNVNSKKNPFSPNKAYQVSKLENTKSQFRKLTFSWVMN